MSIDSAQVAQRFAQAHHSYSDQAVIQKKIAAHLLRLMQQHLGQAQFGKVFEIGCGSGNLSHLFMQAFEFDALYLNDLYPEVQQHFAAAPLSSTQALHWCLGDIEQLPFPQQLDLVISSSALQWVNDIDALLDTAQQALLPQGYLCFSSFGPDNLTEIKTLTGRGLDYLDVEAWTHQLESHGFEVLQITSQHEPMYFEHPLQILKHLKATGVTATAQQHRWNKQSLQQFYQDYQQFSQIDAQGERRYCLSYHPIYCIARKAAQSEVSGIEHPRTALSKTEQSKTASSRIEPSRTEASGIERS